MFKTGDKVVRTSEYYGTNKPFMQKGWIYTVYDYNEDFDILRLVGCGDKYNGEYFELFVETPQVDFKNMKFRVNSPEQSKEIQEALFEMGFCWRSHGCEVRFTDSFPPCDWLYTDKDGYLWRIDSKEDYLVSSFLSAQEHTVETTKSYKLIPKPEPAKETIKIDGKTYDKEAVLKRLAELKEVK